MIRRQSPLILTGSLSMLSFLLTTSLAISQVVSKDQPPAVQKSIPAVKAIPGEPSRDEGNRNPTIDKMIADYDLTPRALPSIPDNPPPHEGAMINLPFVVEPPDLVVVEVLDALPGRPISGERLVRPDGKISLGFYGDISVKGLTLPQIKVAIIKQLRKYLEDETLGLEVLEEVTSENPAIERPSVPTAPGDGAPVHPDGGRKPGKKTSLATPSSPVAARARARSASQPAARRLVPLRPVIVRRMSQERVEQPVPAKAPAKINVPAQGTGPSKTNVETSGKSPPETEKAAESPFSLPADGSPSETMAAWQIVSPEASLSVFVDVSAYNTMNYYVVGDVVVTGRMPFTGNETVLDALQFAGGFTSTADPKNIRLVRPARGGKPAKVYQVDYEAIKDKGDVTANYQIFPGDRLIVGRNDVVTKTVEIDRLNAPISTMTSMMLQEAFMLRALQIVSVDNRDELLKEYVDFWAKALSHQDGVKFDEQTLREAFIRKMKLIPAPVTTTPVPR